MTTWIAILTLALVPQKADETVITVDAGRVLHRVSPLLYGACLEDVNHEIYGGIYSQMIFGESFQEPARTPPLKGFTAFGGLWKPHNGELLADPGDGPKLLAQIDPLAEGEAEVEIRFASPQDGNAGMILKVNQAAVGADKFTGYEVSLESRGRLVLGRHRQNWEPLADVPCRVPLDRWVKLTVKMNEKSLEVLVDGRKMLEYNDVEHPLPAGVVGLRTWRRPAMFRNLVITTNGNRREFPFEPVDSATSRDSVSGMWAAVRRGTAKGEIHLATSRPFTGVQSQKLTFLDGEGEIGVENQGLNRWGLDFVADQLYEGYLWARADTPTPLIVALETSDGAQILSDKTFHIQNPEWTRYDFTLTPKTAANSGRFAIKLSQKGSVDLGHAFLQPGEWGRFRGLPVRKDVVQGLIDQNVGVLRYGGSMINHPQYRWKEMIGPRDRRPTHAGTWYPYSTNGWGIFDFLNVCEAAGFLGIPDVNMSETPQDMADFVEYANGPADSVWGRKRASDGHPEPYRLKHLELGNEEAINDDYWKKFEPIALAIWAKDPEIILVVGDFAYGKVIVDPYHFEGGAAANSLAAHRKILELARSRNREVWFDIHVWTDHPPEPLTLAPEHSYIDQLGKLAPGAKYKVVFFEYNSGNHAMKRALSNALATIQAERIGDLLPIACAANCLQPDGQNDNDWNQGLLFLNPSKVWLQPPGYLVQMARRNFQPLLIHSEIQGKSEKLSVNAKRSDDGKTLVLQVVNWDDQPRPSRLKVQGFTPGQGTATVEILAGPLERANTARQTSQIKPEATIMPAGAAAYIFPPHSITTIRLE